MMSEENTAVEEITVTALDRTLTFATVEALQEHVAEILEHRYGIFDPMEAATITKLAEVANGNAGAEVHHLARKLTFLSPSRPPKIATPYDDKIPEAEEELLKAEEPWLEVRRQLRALDDEAAEEARRLRHKHEGNDHDYWRALDRYREGYRARRAALEEDDRQTRQDLGTARARVNALKEAQSRYRNDHEARFHNPDDPSKPLTLADLHARQK